MKYLALVLLLSGTSSVKINLDADEELDMKEFQLSEFDQKDLDKQYWDTMSTLDKDWNNYLQTVQTRSMSSDSLFDKQNATKPSTNPAATSTVSEVPASKEAQVFSQKSNSTTV